MGVKGNDVYAPIYSYPVCKETLPDSDDNIFFARKETGSMGRYKAVRKIQGGQAFEEEKGMRLNADITQDKHGAGVVADGKKRSGFIKFNPSFFQETAVHPCSHGVSA